MITSEEARALIDDMLNIETIGVTDEKRRELLYREALMKNQCRDWIAIIKTSYTRKMKRIASGKKVINVDDKYLNIAEKFLYGEFAVALDMSKDEVKGYISDYLKKS